MYRNFERGKSRDTQLQVRKVKRYDCFPSTIGYRIDSGGEVFLSLITNIIETKPSPLLIAVYPLVQTYVCSAPFFIHLSASL